MPRHVRLGVTAQAEHPTAAAMHRDLTVAGPPVHEQSVYIKFTAKNKILDGKARERYIYKSLSHRIMRQPFIILLLWLLIPPLASSNYSTVHCANDRDIGINRRQCL